MDGARATPAPPHAGPGAWPGIVVAVAAAVGLGLAAHAALVSSATYDESAYLRIAADWWRTGSSVEMTRMGSPSTFFKLQAGPAFLALERLGLGAMIDRPAEHESTLLPVVRVGSLWIWLAAFGLTVGWSRLAHGPRAMAMAAVLFAAGPNLLGHGSLATMEMPLVATTAAAWLLFWIFLRTGRVRWFAASAAACGLAFSCKFTAALYPPILGLVWLVDRRRKGDGRLVRVASRVGVGMTTYVLILLASDLAATGFAVVRPSASRGDHPSVPASLGWLLETPIPQDWVGFALQVNHQRRGGTSYLLGARSPDGWWYYYPVARAAKLPLGCLVLVAARAWMTARERSARRDWILPTMLALFLLAAMAGSRRNYGVRYLLPMAPAAIVWISRLAEGRGAWRWAVGLGLAMQGVALASVHPHELSFFNRAAGGTIGGRRLLADSNLDWGQGLRALARIEGRFPSLTLFYFGDTDPARYGVRAESYVITATSTSRPLPRRLRVATRHVAVSASLQHGPWGPEGYFRDLDRLRPAAFTDDGTIAIYDVAGVRGVDASLPE